MASPSVCTYCNHLYLYPCNGGDRTCPNFVYLNRHNPDAPAAGPIPTEPPPVPPAPAPVARKRLTDPPADPPPVVRRRLTS